MMKYVEIKIMKLVEIKMMKFVELKNDEVKFSGTFKFQW